jgi:hypothetical protein
VDPLARGAALLELEPVDLARGLQVDELEASQRFAEKARRELVEARRVGREAIEPSRTRATVRAGAECVACGFGHRARGVDDVHRVLRELACDVADHVAQERVVRAAEDERVDLRILREQLREV